jgi:hypothetical protein
MLGHCLYEIKMEDIGLTFNVTTPKRFVKLDILLFCRKEYRLVTYSGCYTVHVSFSLVKRQSLV